MRLACLIALPLGVAAVASAATTAAPSSCGSGHLTISAIKRVDRPQETRPHSCDRISAGCLSPAPGTLAVASFQSAGKSPSLKTDACLPDFVWCF